MMKDVFVAPEFIQKRLFVAGKYLFLAALFFSCSNSPKVKGKKIHISGIIFRTYNEEVKMDTEYTSINDKFYVRVPNQNGEEKNLPDSIITDSLGRFSVDLEKGNYCFVESWQNEPIEMPV